MASKRKLKKDINYVTYELIAECFTLRHLYPEMKEEKFEQVIRDVVGKRNELIARTNHPEINTKEDLTHYYNKVRGELKDLVAMVDNLTK